MPPSTRFKFVLLASEVVSSNGAVSPMIRATPSRTAVTRPDFAAGKVTMENALHAEAPRA